MSLIHLLGLTFLLSLSSFALAGADGDGYPDECDQSCVSAGMEGDTDDNDGYLDNDDAFPLDPNEVRDLDDNGIGDNEDSVGALRDRLELNVLDQRMVSYLGRVAVNLMSDWEDNLLFGESEDWTAARGSTLAGSLLCEDGGGYDISVTRSDFTTLSGTLTAENCKFLGLTVSGTVAFEYEDEYWFQDTPMQHYPLTMTFTNAQIKDDLNRLFTYSGAASCDWRFNNSARTYSRYVHGPDSPYNFGEKYDGALIAVYETGSRFDAGGEGWQSNSLEMNSGGTTDIYPFEYPNCDFENTEIVHVGKTYGVDGLKYIGEYGGAGYGITTLTRQQRKSNGQPFTLTYAVNLATTEVLYDPISTGITPERFSHPELGQFSFSASGSTPGTYQWAERPVSDINFYQQTYQPDHQYLVYLSDESDEFSANNINTPWGEAESWNLGVDLDQDGENDRLEGWATFSWLWTDGTCGWYINRYQGLQLFKEYKPTDLGICQQSNGFYIDSSGKTQFSDVNGDGNNELFDVDDDDDGYLDFADAFPLDATEWLDSDGDGLGDNADLDDDNDGLSDLEENDIGTDSILADSDGDGVGDGDDQFPIDPSESADSDADGVGNNADSDDDNDGVLDSVDLFPLDATEWEDGDGDGVGDNTDVFANDPDEAFDTDGDGVGNNADADDDGDSFSDVEELLAGTNPLSAASCPGCFNWDIDDDGEVKPLTDGLIVIRYLFGFRGNSLVVNAVGLNANRNSPEDISDYLNAGGVTLDIDGDGEAKPLTDGLMLIRYLFGFAGESLLNGAMSVTAIRKNAAEIQGYIQNRLPGSDASTEPSGEPSGSGWVEGEYGDVADFEASCQNPRAGNGFSDVQGTVVDENFWIRAYSFDTYLWFDEIEDVDPGTVSSTEAYFEVMKTFALSPSGNPKDKFHFTYDTEEWNKLSQSGVSAGYGVEFYRVRSSPPRQWLVAYTEPNTPAGDAGLIRGWEIASVDGVDFKEGSDTDVLNAALFPETLGEVHQFVFRDVASGETTSVDLTSQEITSTPVQSVKTIPRGNNKVGYLLFNDHIATAEAQLIEAFEGFKSQGISELVLDMRYNGGGYLDIARMLASMVAGEEAVGQTFSKLEFNSKYLTQNPITGRTLSPSRFTSTAPGFVVSSDTDLPLLNLDRVVVISGSGTCSASEAVINGLRGVGVEVILIGDTTCGKPYGFYGIDNCGTTYFTIQFKGVNAAGFGDYTDGFSPPGAENSGVELSGCAVGDDLSKPLGDINEARLTTALNYLETGSCGINSSGMRSKPTHPLSNLKGFVLKPEPLSGAVMR